MRRLMVLLMAAVTVCLAGCSRSEIQSRIDADCVIGTKTTASTPVRTLIDSDALFEDSSAEIQVVLLYEGHWVTVRSFLADDGVTMRYGCSSDPSGRIQYTDISEDSVPPVRITVTNADVEGFVLVCVSSVHMSPWERKYLTYSLTLPEDTVRVYVTTKESS